MDLKIISGSYHLHLPRERGTGGGEAEFSHEVFLRRRFKRKPAACNKKPLFPGINQSYIMSNKINFKTNPKI
jgi:hypothetical protein